MAELPDLDHLIAAVDAETVTDDPLERLKVAARARGELDDLAEALLDHFVEQAREGGCSWSQIGEALGVSKQAAQQRHTATESVARRLLTRVSQRRRSEPRPFFARFTAPARSVVVLAQEEAKALNHNYIGTEHILLGLIREEEGVAARVLASLEVLLESVQHNVKAIIGEGQETPPGRVPFTPRAKKVLELSLREAINLGHDYIGTEHILLGLLRVDDGVAAKILEALGLDVVRVRDAVLQHLNEAA